MVSAKIPGAKIGIKKKLHTWCSDLPMFCQRFANVLPIYMFTQTF